MTSPAPNWYAVYTYPKLERKIHASLLRQHITTYLPLQPVIRRWSDRIKKLFVPLFPNYLFVQVTDRERIEVLKVAGVSRFISFDGKPAILSETEIEIIRKLEQAELELESHLLTGDRVRIMQGPFAGLEGILFIKKGKERFGVRLDGLRQTLSLEICVSLLKKL